MEVLGIFILFPWLAAVIGVVLLWLGLEHWRARLSTLVAGVAWLLYALYETGMKERWWCTGECNIRVDLLLLYPILLVFTVVSVLGLRRGNGGRREAEPEMGAQIAKQNRRDSPGPESGTEVPTLVEDLLASWRQLTRLLQRWQAPLHARLTAPITPGSRLGLTILVLNLGLFLLAFRDAYIVLPLALMSALGGAVGLAWSALILGGWSLAPFCAAAVIVILWNRGKWHVKLQVAAVLASAMAFSIGNMARGAVGF